MHHLEQHRHNLEQHRHNLEQHRHHIEQHRKNMSAEDNNKMGPPWTALLEKQRKLTRGTKYNTNLKRRSS
jgi:hypothetical protein